MKTGLKITFLIIGLLIGIRLLLCVATPVFDTSEARYAAISANMARTGDFLVPRFTYHGVYQSFDGKPPFLFQSAGVCCRVLGIHEFSVRLPVLTASLALLALLGCVVFVLTAGDGRRSTLAVGVALTSTAYYALMGFCMTDGLLVACVSGALLCHAALIQTGRRIWSLGVFAALGLGMIVKGPVALVEFGIPVVVDCWVNRRWCVWGHYRWITGALLFLLIAAPWFVLRTQTDAGFLKYFFINENLLRFLVHDYGDRYGAGRETFRGMALVWTLVVTLPWSPLMLYRFWRMRGRPWTFRSTSASSVLGWGVVGMTAFWCLTSRVPLAYLIPVVPLFAAWMLVTGEEGEFRWIERLLPLAACGTFLVLTISLLTAMFCSNKMLGAAAPYHPRRFSYEFYHASGCPEELRK